MISTRPVYIMPFFWLIMLFPYAQGHSPLCFHKVIMLKTSPLLLLNCQTLKKMFLYIVIKEELRLLEEVLLRNEDSCLQQRMDDRAKISL